MRDIKTARVHRASRYQFDVGERIGHVAVVSQVGATVSAICECGRTRTYAASNLAQHARKGYRLRCSETCTVSKVIDVGSMTSGHRHGETGTPEHRAWLSLRQRCMNPKNESWHRYGGRGISVCDRWRDSFENFLADMGRRPSNEHSIDRRDNDGPYSPDNCRWETRGIQNNNKGTNVYVEFRGRRQTTSEWAREIGITLPALLFRLKSDEWSVTDALTVREKRKTRGSKHKLSKLTIGQVERIRARRAAGELLSALASEYGVSESLISNIARGVKNWKWLPLGDSAPQIEGREA